jgi:fucose permease
VLGGSIFAFTFVRSLGWLFLLFLLAGMGQGGVDMGVNLVVADAYPEKNTRYLNLIHFFFGMGALTGPALVGLSIQELNHGLPVQWLAAGGMLLLALGVFWVLRNQPLATASTATHTGQKEAIGFRVYASPLLWLMGAVMLIYIGVEYGLGSWVSSFMALTAGVSARDGALLTSLYWGALALGRLAGLGLSKRLTRLQLLLLALGGSLVGAVCLGLLHTRLVPSILCLVWISFSYGTVIPTTIALASTTFPQDKGKVVSVLSAMGSIGGTILPWAAGVFLGRGQVAGYLTFTLAAIAVLLALVLAIRHLLRQHPSGI